MKRHFSYLHLYNFFCILWNICRYYVSIFLVWGDFFILLPSIVMSPLIFQNEGIDNLFHGIIGDKLILGQFSSSNGVKMSNPLQMLFNILSIIRNSWWGNDRLLENLKTDFDTEVIWDISFDAYCWLLKIIGWLFLDVR